MSKIKYNEKIATEASGKFAALNREIDACAAQLIKEGAILATCFSIRGANYSRVLINSGSKLCDNSMYRSFKGLMKINRIYAACEKDVKGYATGELRDNSKKQIKNSVKDAISNVVGSVFSAPLSKMVGGTVVTSSSIKKLLDSKNVSRKNSAKATHTAPQTPQQSVADKPTAVSQAIFERDEHNITHTLGNPTDVLGKVQGQPEGSPYCSSYAIAYAEHIINDKSNVNGMTYWTEGIGGDWGRANMEKTGETQEQNILTIAYEEVYAERPTIIHYGYTKILKEGEIISSGHYVTVVGYQNVVEGEPIKPENLIVLDSGYNKEQGAYGVGQLTTLDQITSNEYVKEGEKYTIDQLITYQK